MRILLISSFFPPMIGGIPSLLQVLLPQMCCQPGTEILVLTTEKNPVSYPHCKALYCELLCNARELTQTYHEVSYKDWDEHLKAITTVVNELAIFSSSFHPDVIFSHTEKIICSLLADKMHLPLVAVMHGVIPSREIIIKNGGTIVRHYDKMLSLQSRLKGIAVYISHYVRQSRWDRGYRPDANIIIPNPIELSNFLPINSNSCLTFRRKLHIPDQAILLCYPQRPGRIGTQIMLQAISEVLTDYRNVYLLICGCPSENDFPLSVKDSFLKSHMRYMKFAKDEMPLVYASSDLTLMPGRDTFGIPSYESLSCGTPVIAPTNSAVYENFHDNRSVFFFKENDHLSLSSTISNTLSTISSHSQHSLLSQQDYARVDPETIALRYLNILRFAINDFKLTGDNLEYDKGIT